jgi:hypothetical protein
MLDSPGTSTPCKGYVPKIQQPQFLKELRLLRDI